MQVSVTLLLLLLASCTQYLRPTSVEGNPVAYDSAANGKLEASAVKKIQDNEVCFDITLTLKGVDQAAAATANWSLAWVDDHARYYLLSLNQRDPASSPVGANNKWTNTFRTCAAKARMNDVKFLILTPKDLPFEATQGLKLEWN